MREERAAPGAQDAEWPAGLGALAVGGAVPGASVLCWQPAGGRPPPRGPHPGFLHWSHHGPVPEGPREAGWGAGRAYGCRRYQGCRRWGSPTFPQAGGPLRVPASLCLIQPRPQGLPRRPGAVWEEGQWAGPGTPISASNGGRGLPVWQPPPLLPIRAGCQRKEVFAVSPVPSATVPQAQLGPDSGRKRMDTSFPMEAWGQ